MKVVVALFGLVVAALAQETSSYTGPLFDPDTAPYFGPSTIVYPSVTESAPVLSNLPTLTPSGSSFVTSMSSAMANSTLSISTLSRNSTTSHSSTRSSSHSSTHSSTSVMTSRTPTPTADETTASASVPTQTGAGVVNLPEAFGAIVGGLVAGLAVL